MSPATENFGAAPNVSVDQAERLAATHFGVRGTASALEGERDRNFHLRTGDGAGFVFKVHPPSEDPAVVDFQIGALAHLAAVDPSLMVPRVMPSVGGESSVLLELGAGRPQIARLLTYVPGVPLGHPLNTTRLRGLGHLLARLDRGLRGYFHSAGRAPLLWDVQRADQVTPLLAHIEDRSLRDAASEGLERFARVVKPALPALRAQVIHNDAHHENVLADPADRDRVVGALDFGDLVHAPLIQELGVAASYHLGADDVLGPTAVLVGAYSEVHPLEADEIEVLADLMLARRAMAAAIGAWMSREAPEPFRLEAPTRRDALRRLLSLSRAEATARLRRAAGV